MPEEQIQSEETSLIEEQPQEGLQDPPPEEKAEEQTPEALTAETINLPEGVEVDQTVMDEFVSVMNDDKLSPKDRAQKLVDMQVQLQKEASEKGAQLWADTQKQWVDEVKNDKDIGGTNFQPTIDRVGKLVDQYGDDKLREVFSLTGAGNNVHMIKFLNNIAKDLTEGGAVSGRPAQPPASPADILYPNQGKE